MTYKAEFSQHRNDMHWKFWTGKTFVRWTGYDDANWWQNVSMSSNARQRLQDGKTYTINFNTCEVTVS